MVKKFVQVKGLNKVMRNLRRSIQKINTDLSRVGMMKAGELVMRRSKAITPVDTGNLKESAFVVFGGEGLAPQAVATSNFNTDSAEGQRVELEHPEVINEFLITKRPDPFAVVGHSAFYALKEHEAVEEKHEIGEPKFLEKAARASQKDILKILKENVKI